MAANTSILMVLVLSSRENLAHARERWSMLCEDYAVLGLDGARSLLDEWSIFGPDRMTVIRELRAR